MTALAFTSSGPARLSRSALAVVGVNVLVLAVGAVARTSGWRGALVRARRAVRLDGDARKRLRQRMLASECDASLRRRVRRIAKPVEGSSTPTVAAAASFVTPVPREVLDA